VVNNPSHHELFNQSQMCPPEAAVKSHPAAACRSRSFKKVISTDTSYPAPSPHPPLTRVAAFEPPYRAQFSSDRLANGIRW
jgi:hypothetical protein